MDYYGHKPINSFFDQEDIGLYKPGGYHPVSLGDSFRDGRYIIHHKLGWGGFATVWLAKDTIHNEWVALKILAARDEQANPKKEISVLRELSAQATAGQAYVVQLLDDFHHAGPNGQHKVLILSLLGPSLAHVIDSCSYTDRGETPTADNRLDAHSILRVTRQLLSTLVVMHQKGVAHGDISSNNIAFTARNIRHASEHDILATVGTPVVEDLVRENGQPVDPRFPKHIVRRAVWGEWVDEDEEDINLIDWGESFRQGEEPERLAQPADCRAPETMFAEAFDYRVDLWRTGVVLYHMVFGAHPFGAFRSGNGDLVAQMIHFVEDLPDEWKDQWLKMKEKSPGLKEETPGISVLEKCFDGLLEDPEDPPLRPLMPVIQGLMRFRPSDRLSASEALQLLPECESYRPGTGA